jgi:hypothetical protein
MLQPSLGGFDISPFGGGGNIVAPFKYIACIFGLLALPGCAIQPLPENVTGKDTYHIVQHVRCEMRDAIRLYVMRMLDRYQPDLAEKIRSGTVSISDLKKQRLDDQVRFYINLYANSEIGYEFTFNITEENISAGSIGFTKPFTVGGSDKLVLSASADLQRQNLRNFRVFDNFEELALRFPDRFCIEPPGPNIIYPITGTIGLWNLVQAFLDLNQSGNLYGSKDKPDVPTIADNLTFTTKLAGTLNPTLSITPVGHVFRFTDAGLKFDESRQDIHQVFVVLTHPPLKSKKHPLLIAEQRFFAEKELDRQRYIANGFALGTIGRAILQTVQ